MYPKVYMQLSVTTRYSCCPANQSRQGFLNLQASGKGAKAPKAKAPAKPAPATAGKTGGRAKDDSTGENANASVQREEEARLLAAVQSVRTSAATDAVGVEDRLKVVAVKSPCSCMTEPCHQSMYVARLALLLVCDKLQQASAGKPLLLSPLKTKVCTAVESSAPSGPTSHNQGTT